MALLCLVAAPSVLAQSTRVQAVGVPSLGAAPAGSAAARVGEGQRPSELTTRSDLSIAARIENVRLEREGRDFVTVLTVTTVTNLDGGKVGERLEIRRLGGALDRRGQVVGPYPYVPGTVMNFFARRGPGHRLQLEAPNLQRRHPSVQLDVPAVGRRQVTSPDQRLYMRRTLVPRGVVTAPVPPPSPPPVKDRP